MKVLARRVESAIVKVMNDAELRFDSATSVPRLTESIR